jgi:uncharacterized protein (DUF2344 family)
MFAIVREVVETASVEDKEAMLNFIDHEVELLEKKSSKSAQTKTQKENEVIKAEILKAFESIDRPVTISEFCELSNSEVASLSNQKLSALFNQLVKAKKMAKTVDKKKSFFSLV